jgi:hypothetical protein
MISLLLLLELLANYLQLPTARLYQARISGNASVTTHGHKVGCAVGPIKKNSKIIM